MNNTLYYGEIVAKISAHLFNHPEQIARFDLIVNAEYDDGATTIYTLCADAARVFDTIENLSEEQFIDWHKALDFYADELLDRLLIGRKPYMIDMISMAARSIENTLPNLSKHHKPNRYSIH